MSIILGLSGFFHDSSAALLVDGEIVAFAEEERFNRIKHTYVYPKNAVDYCLRHSSLTIDDIDCIAYYVDIKDYILFSLKSFIGNLPESISYLKSGSTTMPLSKRLISMARMKSIITSEHGATKPIRLRCVPHYLTHLATAFYPSEFENAAILTMDVGGDGVCHAMAIGEGNKIHVLNKEYTPNALGVFYAAMTKYLGFSFNDEYKVMGMAAYGEPEYYDIMMNELVDYNDMTNSFAINKKYFCLNKYGLKKIYTQELANLLGPARVKSEPLDKRHFNIAASMQKCCEQLGVMMARYLKRVTGLNNLCLSGGVVQNCLMNMKIMQESGFDNVFAQPLCSDVGGSLGAALHVAYDGFGEKKRHPLKHLYYGPEYSDQFIEKLLKEHGLVYTKEHDLAKIVAQDVADGMIVGYFNGRMEAGPRALGNRSLLADPRRGNMKEILNSRVKHREFFRPFAPSVLKEYSSDYFEIPLSSSASERFMIVTCGVKPNVADKIPAVTHEDKTSRIQIVDRDINPSYWNVINEFNNLTGCPVVVNTSFNDNEPIVCTPDDAIGCFKRTMVDTLAIGSFVVRRKDNVQLCS